MKAGTDDTQQRDGLSLQVQRSLNIAGIQRQGTEWLAAQTITQPQQWPEHSGQQEQPTELQSEHRRSKLKGPTGEGEPKRDKSSTYQQHHSRRNQSSGDQRLLKAHEIVIQNLGEPVGRERQGQPHTHGKHCPEPHTPNHCAVALGQHGSNQKGGRGRCRQPVTGQLGGRSTKQQEHSEQPTGGKTRQTRPAEEGTPEPQQQKRTPGETGQNQHGPVEPPRGGMTVHHLRESLKVVISKEAQSE